MIERTMDLLWLLAALPDARPELGRFEGAGASHGAGQIAMIAGAAALTAAACVLLYRLKRRRESGFSTDSPPRLFRDLCRAHRLPAASRRLLIRLAAARSMPNPALLFVEASCFDTADLPEDLKASAERLTKLRDRLFK